MEPRLHAPTASRAKYRHSTRTASSFFTLVLPSESPCATWSHRMARALNSDKMQSTAMILCHWKDFPPPHRQKYTVTRRPTLSPADGWATPKIMLCRNFTQMCVLSLFVTVIHNNPSQTPILPESQWGVVDDFGWPSTLPVGGYMPASGMSKEYVDPLYHRPPPACHNSFAHAHPLSERSTSSPEGSGTSSRSNTCPYAHESADHFQPKVRQSGHCSPIHNG
jgi:hypothetical protein